MFLLNQEKLLISDEFSFFKMTVIVGNFLTTNIGQILFVHLSYEIFFSVDIDHCVSPVPFEVVLQKYLLS